ncbi:MAG: hypothetical protein Q8O24_02095 [Gallionellaceae bacterium]|nr:hypothetical protein [Gallionellaceae bacterium]
MNTEIKKLVFSYECDKGWDSLTLTENPSIRFCSGCQENVFLCGSVEGLKEAVQFERCVAIDELIGSIPRMGFLDSDSVFNLMVADAKEKNAALRESDS